MPDKAHTKSVSYTLSASGVRGLLVYARSLGIACEGALGAAGLVEADLVGPEARISHAAHNALWDVIAEASGDPDFGLHFAERLSLDAFDVVGHLAARSATFGAGLERVVAYSRILHDAGRVEMEPRGAYVAVHPGCRGLTHEVPRHIAELSAASVVLLGRMVTGAPIVPVEVCFRHRAPSRTSEHARVFGVVPRFDEPETLVVLEARSLALASREAQAGLATYLDAYARDVLARLPAEASFASQVKHAIAVELSRGAPDIVVIAARLAMSERTLQRRLTGEGTTFAALIDDVRRAYAERYLADDRLALAEIAFLLGYSEPSNFHRAFRRWTGATPTAFRASLRAQGAEVSPS